MYYSYIGANKPNLPADNWLQALVLASSLLNFGGWDQRGRAGHSGHQGSVPHAISSLVPLSIDWPSSPHPSVTISSPGLLAPSLPLQICLSGDVFVVSKTGHSHPKRKEEKVMRSKRKEEKMCELLYTSRFHHFHSLLFAICLGV